MLMALNGLLCADVPLRNYSPTLTASKRFETYTYILSLSLLKT